MRKGTSKRRLSFAKGVVWPDNVSRHLQDQLSEKRGRGVELSLAHILEDVEKTLTRIFKNAGLPTDKIELDALLGDLFSSTGHMQKAIVSRGWTDIEFEKIVDAVWARCSLRDMIVAQQVPDQLIAVPFAAQIGTAFELQRKPAGILTAQLSVHPRGQFFGHGVDLARHHRRPYRLWHPFQALVPSTRGASSPPVPEHPEQC